MDMYEFSLLKAALATYSQHCTELMVEARNNGDEYSETHYAEEVENSNSMLNKCQDASGNLEPKDPYQIISATIHDVPDVPKLWRLYGLNCHDSHVLEVYYRGGMLQHGWAVGPDGSRYQHVWILRNAKIVDLFNWTNHEPTGFRDLPLMSATKELRSYLKANMIDWIKEVKLPTDEIE